MSKKILFEKENKLRVPEVPNLKINTTNTPRKSLNKRTPKSLRGFSRFDLSNMIL